MYKFPKNFNANVFIDHILEMICFNVNQATLHFSGSISICAGGPFEFQKSPNTGEVEIVDFPTAQSDLMQLLECSVSQVFLENEDTLTLVFDNSQRLRFLPDSSYESYHLNIDGGTITI